MTASRIAQSLFAAFGLPVPPHPPAPAARPERFGIFGRARPAPPAPFHIERLLAAGAITAPKR